MTDYEDLIALEFRLERHSNDPDRSAPPFAVWGLGADGRHQPIRELNDMRLSEFKASAKRIIGELSRDHPALKMSFHVFAVDYRPVEGRPPLDGRRLELRGGLIQVTEQEWLDRLAREKTRPEKDGPKPAGDHRK